MACAIVVYFAFQLYHKRVINASSTHVKTWHTRGEIVHKNVCAAHEFCAFISLMPDKTQFPASISSCQFSISNFSIVVVKHLFDQSNMMNSLWNPEHDWILQFDNCVRAHEARRSCHQRPPDYSGNTLFVNTTVTTITTKMSLLYPDIINNSDAWFWGHMYCRLF